MSLLGRICCIWVKCTSPVITDKCVNKLAVANKSSIGTKMRLAVKTNIKRCGFYLKRAPEDLNIGDLVVLLENTLQIVECKTPLCKILPACKLKGILGQATQAFLDSLKAYTLADLLEDEAKNLITLN